MPKPILTPEEKEKKKARDALGELHARILSAWSWKQIATWTDFYRKMGLPTVRDEAITFPFLKEELAKQKRELEDKLNGQISTPTQPTIIQEVLREQPTSLQEASKPTSNTIQKELSRSEKASEGNVKEVEVVENIPLQAKKVVEQEKRNAGNNYLLTLSPNEKAFHYWFQKKAASEILEKIGEGKRGVLLLAPTGTGKTFMVSAVARRLWDANYHEGKTWSHIPYLWVTKTTVVEQASRVLKNFYNISPVNDVEVINIEQLRSKSGQLWLKKVETVKGGDVEEDWIWNKNINPCVVFFDESQGAKNSTSTQHKIILSYSDIPKNATLISISATPFVRVAEAKYWAVSTHAPIGNRLIAGKPSPFPEGAVLSAETWPTYSALISDPSDPYEYNQSAVERLMQDLEDYVVRVTGARPQFKAHNRVLVIPFETEEKRQFYHSAWERFLKEKAKIESAREAGDDTNLCMFTVLLKFAMAAEFCHAEHFADDMYRAVEKEGKAAVAAVKFKQTIIEIVKILITKYGVSRDKISLVWGGGQTQLTEKQKAKQKVKDLEKKFKEMGIEIDEILTDTGLDEVEDRVIQELPAAWKLGPQDMDTRQREIDRFQKGESLYCLYTFKSGGVGLSLHHTDELTKYKCRRKESGYAVEEDIPSVPVRPRKNHVSLTYSAIELVQGVGRCPRLTSLSDTEQNIYAYAGTVEVDIGNIVSQKLRCLSSVVKMKEDWQDIIMKGSNESERAMKVKELLASTKNVKTDNEDELVTESEGEE